MKTYNEIKKQIEITRRKSPSKLEIYSSYFDELDFELYRVLENCGMLGRLFRGQRIDITDKDIYIPYCSWRYEKFKLTNQYVPCVVKSKNPYWAEN